MKMLYLKEEQQNFHICNDLRYSMQMFLIFSYHVFHNWVAVLIPIQKDAHIDAV